MGPRLMSRGKTGTPSGREIYRRFNGAAAHEPRKGRRLRSDPPWPDTASMGPRLMSRGKGAAFNAELVHVTLQWGRGS